MYKARYKKHTHSLKNDKMNTSISYLSIVSQIILTESEILLGVPPWPHFSLCLSLPTPNITLEFSLTPRFSLQFYYKVLSKATPWYCCLRIHFVWPRPARGGLSFLSASCKLTPETTVCTSKWKLWI